MIILLITFSLSSLEKMSIQVFCLFLKCDIHIYTISSVQSLSHVRLFANPWIAACQAFLSITNSRSSLILTSIELVMPSRHLILCRPLLLLSPIPLSIRVFSNESTLLMRWPKCWSFSFSISPSYKHPGQISFRMDWLDLLAVQGTLKSLLQHHSSVHTICIDMHIYVYIDIHAQYICIQYTYMHIAFWILNHMRFADIFSHSIGCLFNLLTNFFATGFVFHVIQVVDFFFSLYFLDSKNSFPKPVLRRLLLMFSSRNFTLPSLTFKYLSYSEWICVYDIRKSFSYIPL